MDYYLFDLFFVSTRTLRHDVTRRRQNTTFLNRLEHGLETCSRAWSQQTELEAGHLSDTTGGTPERVFLRILALRSLLARR